MQNVAICVLSHGMHMEIYKNYISVADVSTIKCLVAAGKKKSVHLQIMCKIEVMKLITIVYLLVLVRNYFPWPSERGLTPMSRKNLSASLLPQLTLRPQIAMMRYSGAPLWSIFISPGTFAKNT